MVESVREAEAPGLRSPSVAVEVVRGPDRAQHLAVTFESVSEFRDVLDLSSNREWWDINQFLYPLVQHASREHRHSDTLRNFYGKPVTDTCPCPLRVVPEWTPRSVPKVSPRLDPTSLVHFSDMGRTFVQSLELGFGEARMEFLRQLAGQLRIDMEIPSDR